MIAGIEGSSRTPLQLNQILTRESRRFLIRLKVMDVSHRALSRATRDWGGHPTG